ncbi:MAG: CPBP family intramembrane metalloprotease [Planctomycetes bacterium]|nr:CPBP family intramembrane metalloprotease [Planctomycetota bacterium]
MNAETNPDPAPHEEPVPPSPAAPEGGSEPAAPVDSSARGGIEPFGPKNPFDRWLAGEFHAFALLGLACLLIALQASLPAAKKDDPAPDSAVPVRPAEPGGAPDVRAAPDERAFAENQAAVGAPLLLLMVTSLVAFVVVVGGGAAARKGSGDSFWVPKSNCCRPDLTLLDLLVVFAFFVALFPYLNAATQALTPDDWWIGEGHRRMPTGVAGRLAMMAQTFLMYCVVVAGAVVLARKRGGPNGAAGLWPFWPRGEAGALGGLARDAVYAWGVLFVCVWIPMATNLVGHMVVTEWLGAPDENPVVTFMREELQERPSAGLLAFALIAAAVCAPFFEELIFRGIVYNVMRRYLGVAGGAVVASALFALAHGVWSDFAALFVLGILMTWIYERRGNLWSAMVVHATNNLIFVLVLFYRYNALKM